MDLRLCLLVVASLLVGPSFEKCIVEMRNPKSRFLRRDVFVLCRNFGNISGGLYDEIGKLAKNDTVKVDVQDSDISTVPTEGFTGLRISELRLEHINITQVSPGAFDGLRNLTKLSLRLNRIETLHKNVFSTDLANLTELDISENELKTVEEGAFEALVRLQLLHMNNNLLVTLPENLFVGSSVTILDLSENKILVFPKGFFRGLPNLKILALANSNLMVIQPDLFKHNGKLIQVQLEKNNLEHVRNWTLPAVRFLNLSSCHLRTLAYSNFERVEALDLSENGLESMDHMKLDSLVDLNLRRNYMKFSDDFSSNMRNVQRLVLSENSIQHIDTSMFQFYGVKYLDLSKNLLVHLETFRFPLLETLILHHNSLTRLKLSIMRELKELDLSYNRFSEISFHLLENLHHLRKLDFSNNQIRNISLGAFRDMSSTLHLDLSNNNIEKLEVGVFVGLTHMDFLDISHNSLTALDEGVFHSFSGVRWLNISFNNVSYETARHTFSHLQYNSELKIEGNAWYCNQIVAFIKENRVVKVGAGSASNVTNIRGIACTDAPEDPAKRKVQSFYADLLSKINLNNYLLIGILAMCFFKLCFDAVMFRHKLMIWVSRNLPDPQPSGGNIASNIASNIISNIRPAPLQDEMQLLQRNEAEDQL